MNPELIYGQSHKVSLSHLGLLFDSVPLSCWLLPMLWQRSGGSSAAAVAAAAAQQWQRQQGNGSGSAGAVAAA
jgi:hypothetical protein